jgi:AcrR family transcriptional regulator
VPLGNVYYYFKSKDETARRRAACGTLAQARRRQALAFQAERSPGGIAAARARCPASRTAARP